MTVAMTIERALAEWAANVSDTHTDRARSLAQDALVDITGCIIAGSVEVSTHKVVDVVKASSGGAALAMGSNLRLPAPWAAFVSGTAAHALDYDDNFAPGVTHATAVLAPALFALADEYGLSGAKVIDAYIVGLELQARVGRLVNPVHYEKGWHATSTVGAIGTAGGCARLLGLDADGILAAMSIAFSLAGGSKKQFGSMMKPIHAGIAAKHAVLAAQMARAGITGNEEPLGGRWGFAELCSEPLDEPRARALTLTGLGSSLAIETDGLMPKRFPCCGAAHRTLDGLAALREQHGFSLDEVDRIEAFIPAFARGNLRFDDPQNENEARFSLTYCGVRVAQTGRLTLSDLTPARVSDASIRPWLGRFVIHTKPGSVADELGENATPAITRVVLKSGAVREIGITMPKGTKNLPFTPDEQREKFRDCCQWAGKAADADRLFELARSLHKRPFREFSRDFAQALG